MKAKHYLFAAVLILVMGFLISYNGSLITGKYSKSITGMTTKNVGRCGECPQECIDNNAECINEGVSAECDAAFQSCYFPCIVTKSVAYCVDLCNPKKIKYTCSYEEAPCEDTDVSSEYPDGKNYYQEGQIWGFSYGYPDQYQDGTYDHCSGGNMVTEFYCRSDYTDWVSFECPDGCADGACITAPEEEDMTCIDSDEGNYPYIKGEVTVGTIAVGGEDKCTNAPFYNRLSEAVCKDNYLAWESKNCGSEKNSCVDGACVIKCDGIVLADGTPYSYADDLCDGYRCLVDNEITPSGCYDLQGCNDVCTGECMNISFAKEQCSVCDPLNNQCYCDDENSCLNENIQDTTYCVWTNKHCCGNEEYWYFNLCTPIDQISEISKCDAGYFWPDNQILGEGIKDIPVVTDTGTPYNYADDICAGYRCLEGNVVGTSCYYPLQKCNDVCAGECIDPPLTKEEMAEKVTKDNSVCIDIGSNGYGYYVPVISY